MNRAEEDVEKQHERSVRALMARTGGDRSMDVALDLLERATGVLFRRARHTVRGETLVVVLTRVVAGVAEDYAKVATLRVDAGGIDANVLRRAITADDAGDVTRAVRAVLTGFLTVLGKLTGEVLASALHEELDGIE